MPASALALVSWEGLGGVMWVLGGGDWDGIGRGDVGVFSALWGLMGRELVDWVWVISFDSWDD